VITAPWVRQGPHVQTFLYLFLIYSGPQEDPDICGTPILCMFYGLLMFIVCLTLYTTLQGSTGGRQTNFSLENQDFPKTGMIQLEVETSPKKDEILTVK
jgi:hypothetical protein